MIIDENFLNLILDNNKLNESQLKILELDFPFEQTYINKILNKDIARNETNLLMLLKKNF